MLWWTYHYPNNRDQEHDLSEPCENKEDAPDHLGDLLGRDKKYVFDVNRLDRYVVDVTMRDAMRYEFHSGSFG